MYYRRYSTGDIIKVAQSTELRASGLGHGAKKNRIYI